MWTQIHLRSLHFVPDLQSVSDLLCERHICTISRHSARSACVLPLRAGAQVCLCYTTCCVFRLHVCVHVLSPPSFWRDAHPVTAVLTGLNYKHTQWVLPLLHVRSHLSDDAWCMLTVQNTSFSCHLILNQQMFVSLGLISQNIVFLLLLPVI